MINHDSAKLKGKTISMFSMNTIKIKKMRPAAIIPQRATHGSAGYDLCVCIEQPITIAPGETVKLPSGIAIAIENPQVAAFIYARSSLGGNFGIIPANCVGVIDSDYRGEISISLRNSSAQSYTVEPNQRVAQMIFAPVLTPAFTECAELPATPRGENGYGSTGKI